jgi:predicted kinase
MLEFTMLVGLPGSGKSTLAQQLLAASSTSNPTILLSTDELRKELFHNVNEQCKNEELYRVLHQRLAEAITHGQSVIYDATNLQAKHRIPTLALIREACTKASTPFPQCTCIIVATPPEICIEQDKSRPSRHAGKKVINRMLRLWTTPSYGEGWNNIQLYYPSSTYPTYYGDYLAPMQLYQDYNQNNPYHTRTLGEHLSEVANTVALSSPASSPLAIAASLHDIGKPRTKTTDPNGISHYYQHANVGGYLSLFYDYPADKLLVSTLVCYHMHPYNWNTRNQQKNAGEVHPIARRGYLQ